jgi:cation diffusion facilitator family transporter
VETPRQVYVAAIANIVVASSKFTVGAITGSSAMIAEGIHSVADTGNQLLIVLGIKRSRKPPDEKHPFGYGLEIYFWGFMVAVLLFSIGGVLSIFEGVSKLRGSSEMGKALWNYVVLAVAAVAETVSLRAAFKPFRKSFRGDEHWWHAFRTSKDPTVFIVLAEDSAGLLGIAVAAAGIGLEQLTQSPVPDAIAAIVIGIILCAVAILMAYETKALLLGESADREVVEEIRRIVSTDPIVVVAGWPLTMHFAPNEILVNMEVEFDPKASANEIVQSIDRFETQIRQRHPKVKHIFIEAEAFRKKDSPRRTE